MSQVSQKLKMLSKLLNIIYSIFQAILSAYQHRGISYLTEVQSQFRSTGSMELFLTLVIYSCGRILFANAFSPCLLLIMWCWGKLGIAYALQWKKKKVVWWCVLDLWFIGIWASTFNENLCFYKLKIGIY